MTEAAVPSAQAVVPRPAAMPGLPYFGGIVRMKKDPIGYLREASGRGPVVRLGRLGRRSFYQVNDPDLVRSVMTAPGADVGMTRTSDVLGFLFGESVFTMQGEPWRKRRDELQPAFRTSNLPELFGSAAGEIEQTVEHFQPVAEARGSVDFSAALLDLLQRMIVRMMFGVAVPETAAQLTQAFDYGLAYRQRRRWALTSSLPLWFPTPANRKFDDGVARLNASIVEIIEDHRAHPPQRAGLLTMLMECRDAETGVGWSDDELLAEVKTTFVAGWLTTTTAATWLFDLLARHPEVAARVVAEIDALPSGRPLECGDLHSLEFVEDTILEAMRLFPPGWLLSRRVRRPFTLGDITLSPNSVLLVSPYALHRDPTHWNEPDRFDPDRFHSKNHGEAHKAAFLPFGFGPRVCIGRGVAMMELKMIVATLLRRFRLTLADTAPAKLQPVSFLRRADPLILDIAPR
ncbi:cytochrome P450 [Streptomyces sp. NPDC087212]|uniref:cytochrome P450 n=1 Tax=Streptomyces sp. NPDC087212 TaxID=3365766 RepID=UPI00381FBBAB